MKRVSKTLALMVLSAGTLLGSTALAAGDGGKLAQAGAKKPSAEIRVRVIHASNEGKKFDPRLEDLRKFLRHHKFTAFKQVIDDTIPVEVDQTKGIGLLSGKNLNVTLKKLEREKATIRLLLLGKTGQILDTTVAAGPHKLFFLAGPRYDGGILFVAIEPHYDPASLAFQEPVGDARPR